jgi:microcystin-dependent protein
MEIKLKGRTILAILLLSAGIAGASAISQKNSGIIVEEEQLPIGSVALWGNTIPPKGWLEMNGQSISSYSELSSIYGSNLPDMRGEFVRGYDNGRGVDAGRTLRSHQAESINPTSLSFKGDPLPPHSHEIYGGYQGGYSNTYANADAAGGSHSYKPNTYGASAGTPTGVIQGDATETRPRNIALMYIVKAE